jgi:MFS family permease
VTPQDRPSAADPGRLPPTVRALGWTSFFTDLSSEAIYPLLPGFVKSLGGGGEAIGLIDGAANAVAAIVRLPSGMLSDRVGRRPLVLFGYGLSAVVRPLMAFVGTPLQVLFVRAADLGVPQPFIPLVWFGISVAKTIAATGAGRIVDRVDPRRGIIAGWLAFAAAYTGLSVATSLWIVLPLLMLVGIAYGVAEPAERALVAALAPAGSQGRSFGWYALVQGLMALPAGLIAGWLWERSPQGAATAFGLTAVLSVIACGVILGVRRGLPARTTPVSRESAQPMP